MAEFKTVRGMRDFLPEKALKKSFLEKACVEVFQRYGFVPVETPVVEEFGLLAKKGSGGEAIKEEIYYFKDKSERELGLRFDLTVPLARVVSSNPQLSKPFKRYQIGRVYRYDRPGEKRYREFTQADFDIVGSGSPMADFEVIAVAVEAMKAFGFKKGEFFVKVNSRPLLEKIVSKAGIQKETLKDCFRCLDKLDKLGEKGVKKELEEKGFNAGVLESLKEKPSKQDLPEEFAALLDLLEKAGLSEFVELDLSLARGLEYYTGMVFEVCVKGCPSVGAGGRYDRLVGLYGGQETACVGGSFGIDRLLDLLEQKIRPSGGTRVFVVPVGKEMQLPALELAQKIRGLGVNAAMDLNSRGISKNLDYANKLGIPFVAIFGENELKSKEFSLKEMDSGKERKVKMSGLKKLPKMLEK
jgi:histidyl-tRNA synthetase